MRKDLLLIAAAVSTVLLCFKVLAEGLQREGESAR